MQYLPTKKDETPTLIFNPSTKDFTCKMANEQNIQEEYIIKGKNFYTFPKYIADFIAKHLAQSIALEKETITTDAGPVRVHYEERLKAVLSKIYVTI